MITHAAHTHRHWHGDGPHVHRRWSPTSVVLTVLLAIATVIAGSVVGGGLFYAGSVASTFTSTVKHLPDAFPPAATRPAPASTGAMNILLIGSDSRGDPTAVGQTRTSNQRSDTMMLVHIDADRKDVYVMSIMRDLWVPIPGKGTAKINAALAWGGTPLAIQTVEQLLGTHIDHVAIIDFQGLEGMTDALGGVDVDSPVGFTTVLKPHYTFVKGLNHLDGSQALSFARERYAFPTADYQRVANQQVLLQAIIHKLLSRATLTDPAAVTSFAGATGRYLSVDAQFDLPTIIGLAASMRLSGASSIHAFTMPTAGTGTSPDGQSIVILDEATLPALRAAFATDRLGTLVP
jgi:LCP family protein required for cell wall assembly